MLPYEAFYRKVLDKAWRTGVERCALPGAAGRVLAEDVRSDVDVPPFDKSSMDGYACRRADLPGPLEVIGEVPAGGVFTGTIGSGQCAKIFTGAPVPTGADCVVIVEQSEILAEGAVRFSVDDTPSNITPQAQDLRVGDVVLASGTLLLPQHLAALAMAGAANPLVAQRPRVGVFATGDELVPPDALPGPGQIRNSNSFQIRAMAEAGGAVVQDYGTVRDRAEELRNVVRRALSESDVVLSTGGVSMGDYDLVPGVLEEAGLRLQVQRVLIQPGKPIAFATGEKKAFFGLSGNPLSSYLQFLLFVRPFLFQIQGAHERPAEVRAKLASPMQRRNTERMAWFPVVLRDGMAEPIEFHGSAHIHALCDADGLCFYPIGCDRLEQGQELPVRLIR